MNIVNDLNRVVYRVYTPVGTLIFLKINLSQLVMCTSMCEFYLTNENCQNDKSAFKVSIPNSDFVCNSFMDKIVMMM